MFGLRRTRQDDGAAEGGHVGGVGRHHSEGAVHTRVGVV